MNPLASMLLTKVDRGIPALVVRLPYEGRPTVSATCPPGDEQDRLMDWISTHDDLAELVAHAFRVEEEEEWGR